MNEPVSLALEKVVNVKETYQDSMEVLKSKKKALAGVQKAIHRYTTPLVPALQYFRRDWTSLSGLLNEQIALVGDISTLFSTMATTFAADTDQLIDYTQRLDKRSVDLLEKQKGLEETVATSRQDAAENNGLLARLRGALTLRDVQCRQQRTKIQLQHTQQYAQELVQLLPIAQDVYHVFVGAAELVAEREEHLRETGNVYAGIVELGKSSRQLRQILQTIDQNSKAVYGAVNQGLTDIHALFNKLQSYRSLTRLQLPAPS